MNKLLRTLTLYFAIAFTLSTAPAQACDVCNLYECSPLQQRTFFGLVYRYRVLNGYGHLGNTHSFTRPGSPFGAMPLQHGLYNPIAYSQHEPDEREGVYADKSAQDYETYRSWELRANYTFKQKVNLMVLLPYEHNTVYYRRLATSTTSPFTDSTMRVKGFGDLTIAADWIHQTQKGAVKHTLRPGIIIKAPTGRYRVQNSEGQAFDPVIQPGAGAWAYGLRLNYQWYREGFGFDAGMSYVVNSNGRHGYDFANSFNISQVFFYQFQKGLWNIIPRAGAYLESTGNDAYQGVEQQLSGGTSLFGQLGVDINRWQHTLQITYQMPLADNLAGNQIGNAGRLAIAFIFSPA